MAIEALSHIGICVRDLERSLRFYCDGLGFREVSRLSVAGEPASRLLELEGVALEAVYLARDGTTIELLAYAAPEVRGAGAPRAMNELGLTHLSVRVRELEGALEQLARAGGRVLEHTRIAVAASGASAAFVLDPDGTRVELVAAARS